MTVENLNASNYLRSENEINVHIAVVENELRAHTHDFIEMVFILSGKGIHVVDGEEFQVIPGDLFILNANVSHSFKTQGESPLVVYNCIFQGAFLNERISENTEFLDLAFCHLFHSINDKSNEINFLKITDMPTQDIKGLLDEIRKENEEQKTGYLQVIHANFTKMMIFVFRMYRKNGQRNEKSERAILVENTMRYMKVHYRDNIACEDLAKRAYISTNYLSKIFKEESGDSIIQSLQKIRIEEAIKLIMTTRLSIELVAEEVGYYDIKHFYRIFKKITGCTPGEYRKK